MRIIGHIDRERWAVLDNERVAVYDAGGDELLSMPIPVSVPSWLAKWGFEPGSGAWYPLVFGV